jgi:hypothetical protein
MYSAGLSCYFVTQGTNWKLMTLLFIKMSNAKTYLFRRRRYCSEIISKPHWARVSATINSKMSQNRPLKRSFDILIPSRAGKISHEKYADYMKTIISHEYSVPYCIITYCRVVLVWGDYTLFILSLINKETIYSTVSS